MLVVSGSLVAGVFFGTGLSSTAVEVADGLTWLSDDDSGQIIQVNPATGKLEVKQVVGNPGDDIAITAEHDGQLYVTDHTTGRLLAFDLTSILVSGQRRVSAGGVVDTLAGDDGVFLVDSEDSTIAAMDPQTTDAIGTIWVAPAGLADAAIDDDGTVWALEDNGVLHRLRWSSEQLAFDDDDPQTVEGSGPGSVLVAHDRGVTVFAPDEGRVAQVGTGDDLSADAPKVIGELYAPETAPRDLVPVAAPENGFVVLLTSAGIVEVDMGSISCGDPGTPEVFRGEVFVPCRGQGRVVRLGADGMRSDDDILTPGSRDPEVVLDDDSLIVNAPGAAQGVVVHADGHTSAIVREDEQLEAMGLNSSSAPQPSTPVDVIDDLLSGLGGGQDVQDDEPSTSPPTIDPGDPDPTSPPTGSPTSPPTANPGPGGPDTGGGPTASGDRCDDDEDVSLRGRGRGADHDQCTNGGGSGGPGGSGSGGSGGSGSGGSGGSTGQPATAPTGVVATALPEGQVQVTWKHSGFPKPDSFVIRSSTGEEHGPYKSWVRQTFVDVAPGEPVSFTVAAVLDDRKAVSYPSNEVTSTARPGAPVVTGTATYETDDDEVRFLVEIAWQEAAANGEDVSAYDVSVTTPDGPQSTRTDSRTRKWEFEWTCDRRRDAGCTVGGDFQATVMASSALGTGEPGVFAGTAPAQPPAPLPDADKQHVERSSPTTSTAAVDGSGTITLRLRPADDWRRFPDQCAYELDGVATEMRCDARSVTITYANGPIQEPQSGVVEHQVAFVALNDGGTARSAAYKFTTEQPVIPDPFGNGAGGSGAAGCADGPVTCQQP